MKIARRGKIDSATANINLAAERDEHEVDVLRVSLRRRNQVLAHELPPFKGGIAMRKASVSLFFYFFSGTF